MGDAAATPKPAVTVFLCGPSKCDHDYSRSEPILVDDRIVGESAVCSKCGRSAFEEGVWGWTIP